MRRRAAAAAVSVLGAVLVTPMSWSAASWGDREHVAASTSAADPSCATAGVYRTVGRARFLSGQLGSRALDRVAAVQGVAVTNDGAGAIPDRSAAPSGTDAYSAPLDLVAARGAVSAQLGVALPVLPGSAGTFSQWAQARSVGDSTGASGAVTSGGAIDVGAFSSTDPSAASVDVGSVLPSTGSPLPGVPDLTVEVGAVAATATARTCASRWDAAVQAVARDYRIASLRLALHDAAVTADLGAITRQRTAVAQASASLTAPASDAASAVSAAASDGFASAVRTALGGLGLVNPLVGTPSTTVDITLDASAEAAVGAALGERLTDAAGIVAVRFDTGAVTIDLGALHTLNGAPPNTDVLTAADVTRVRAALGSLLDTHARDVEAAWAASAAAMTVRVRVSVPVTARVALIQTTLATVSTDVTGTVARYRTGEEPHPAATVTAVNGWVGAPLLAVALTPALLQTSFSGPLEAAVRTSVASPMNAAIASATTVVDAAATTAATGSSSELAPLSDVLDVLVDVRPDAAPYPAPYDADVPGGAASISALRVTAAAGATPLLGISLASASVGPNSTRNG